MNYKKTTSLAMTAIIGASLLATPLTSHAATSTTSTTTATVTDATSIKIGDTVDKTIKSGDVLKYKFSVPRANKIATVATLSDANGSVDVKDKLSVVVKDSKGKIVSNAEAMEFLGVKMLVTDTNLPKGAYTIEIRGLSAIQGDGLSLDFALTEDENPDFTFSKIKSSKVGVLPQKIATTLTPSATDKNVQYKVEVKAPTAKKYKLVRNYGSKMTYKFKSSKVGTHTVKYSIKNESGKVHTKTLKIKVVKAVTPSKLKVTASKTAVKPKQKVTLKASAKGANLQYKYTYKLKGSKTTHVIKNYSTSKTVTFKAPTKKGTYTVTTYVKQTNGNKIVKAVKTIVVK